MYYYIIYFKKKYIYIYINMYIYYILFIYSIIHIFIYYITFIYTITYIIYMSLYTILYNINTNYTVVR